MSPFLLRNWRCKQYRKPDCYSRFETYIDYGSVSGWKNWTNPTVNDIVVKEDNTELTVALLISDLTAGVWGSFDDVSLCRTGDYEPSIEEPTDDGKDIVKHIHQKVEKVVKKVVSEVNKIIKNIFGKWFK